MARRTELCQCVPTAGNLQRHTSGIVGVSGTQRWSTPLGFYVMYKKEVAVCDNDNPRIHDEILSDLT